MYSTSFRIFFIWVVLSTLGSITLGCGKVAPPWPPEMLSPKAVEELTVNGTTGGLKFAWKAPKTDLRGEKLESMIGYRIARKQLIKPSDISDDSVEFEEITVVPDTHVSELKKLQAEARAKNLPTHRVNVDGKLKQFEYIDSSVKAGQSYLYQVIPVNQNDVEGEITQLVRVTYRGEASKVNFIPYSSLDDEAFLSRYE